MARWHVRLSGPAERDFSGIIGYTLDTYGAKQAKIYGTTMTRALAALHSGPDLRGSVERGDIGPGLRTLHIARNGRKGRHLILFRAAPPHTIEVVRILHDVMDLAQHVPKSP